MYQQNNQLGQQQVFSQQLVQPVPVLPPMSLGVKIAYAIIICIFILGLYYYATKTLPFGLMDLIQSVDIKKHTDPNGVKPPPGPSGSKPPPVPSGTTQQSVPSGTNKPEWGITSPYWWGVATGQTGGIVAWTPFTAKRYINLNPDDSTQLILPYVGTYEIILAGGANISAVNQGISMFVNGVPYLSQPIYIAKIAEWTNVSMTAFVNVTTINTYVQFTLSDNILLTQGVPLVLTAKFISL